MTEQTSACGILAGGGLNEAEEAGPAVLPGASGVLDLSIGGVLDKLASDDPQWGGGSAVLLGASMGACLLAMAARISAAGARQGKFVPPALTADGLEDMGEELAAQAGLLAEWAAADGALYGRVVAAQRLPKEQPEVRSAAILEALREAIEGPLQVSRLILDVLRRAQVLAGSCKKANFSDIASGVQLLRQGIRGALLNVKQNCGQRECFAVFCRQADQLSQAAEEITQSVLEQCC